MRILMSSMFALYIWSASAYAADCDLITCGQARKSMDIVAEGFDDEKEVILVSESGEKTKVEWANHGMDCHSSIYENIADAKFLLNHRAVNISRLYVDGKNVATQVGCTHKNPATL